MAHRNRICKNISLGIALCTITIVVPSCIDELYNLNNGISSEMALGGDSLALPIGSTDTIRLSDFLSTDDIEMLKTMEDGGYGLTMKDSITLDVPKIDQASLKIDDQKFSQSQSVNFGEISLDQFKIPAVSVNNNIDLNISSISMSNFAIPAISDNKSFAAGMSDYVVTNTNIAEKTVNAGKNDILSGVNLPSDPGGNNPVELPIADPGAKSFVSNNSLNYAIQVPDGVSNIDRIELVKSPPKGPAVFEVSIELAGASGVLTAGSVIPDITINPSDLFVFASPPSGGNIRFDSNDLLTVANGFKKTKILNIDALNITNEPVNGSLSVAKTIQSSGNITLSGAKVISDKLSSVYGMDLKVTVSIRNLEIESMDFDIPTLRTAISGETSFTINNNLPTDINQINKVYFNNPGTISFDLQTQNLPNMINKTITIDNLRILFPNKFVFEPKTGLSGQTFTINGESFNPSTGKKIELNLKELNMSDIALINNNLNWTGNISYTGTISFKGRINSKNIPQSATGDTKMGVGVSSSLSFQSAEVKTNPIAKILPVTSIPLSLNIDIADKVKHLGVINLKPGTMLNVHLGKPELPLSLNGDHIQIEFPPIFGFKQTLLNNIYPIDGPIPEDIQLELTALNINKDLTAGKLTLTDNIVVKGGINLLSGIVNSQDISTIGGKKMSVNAATTDMNIASTSIQLKTLDAEVADTTKLQVTLNDLPAEIMSLDSILLEDGATLQLSVNIENMPKLSRPLVASMTLDFPDMLRFAPGEVNARNQMSFTQAFVDNRLNKTIGIKGLHFDSKELKGKLSINEDIGFKVNVSVQDPSVNSEDLNGNPIQVRLDVLLGGIRFKSVYGKVNPGIQPVSTHVKLGNLPDFMKDEDIVLDITKPVIALETRSNLGIPIKTDMTLTPIKKGNTLSPLSVSLDFPKSGSARLDRISRFWIAPDSAGMSQSFDWKKVDIQDLFKTLPDEINFIVNAQANTSEEHCIDLDANYRIKVKYDVTIPMAFGKDLAIEIRDTIADLDASVGETALSGRGLEVFGSVLNSIPLELMLTLTPLDKDNKPINVPPATQMINAGAHDGSATPSNLSFKLEDPNGLLKDVRGFEMKFRASSNETVAGTPIRPENFVKADLKIRLKGGIKIGEN